MRKLLIVTMLLIAVLFMSNVAVVNASVNSTAGEAGDYRENNPC
ncbi:MAG: hypothetical protein AABY58_03190 [Nitrospirota bacterium]